MNIYQVPLISQAISQTFISVIDASGSMRPFWSSLVKHFNHYIPKENAITITFDTTPYFVTDNILSEDIFKHGGGGTNITAAFEMMDQKIEKLDKNQMLTILFISDGQDNNIDSVEYRFKKLKGNQGRTVTFICLGIQSQFPTFISMQLRKLYHNGLPSIPALYLIEYCSDVALFNKFETMKAHFTHKKLLSIKPPVIAFPWLPPQSQVYERTWILTEEKKLLIEGKEEEVTKARVGIESMLEVFRGYVQELQMISLMKNNDIKVYAAKALETMKALMEHYSKMEEVDLDVWIEDSHLLKARFYERCKLHELRHKQFRLKAFIESVTELAKGEEVKELDEWEVAKKIGVGTITGTYQQKVLSLKKFTIEVFQDIRKDFLKLYKTLKLNPETDQEFSDVLKQTQKDVFRDPDFIKGLELCENQFDLAETLPLIGRGLQLKRYIGSLEDPWMVGVKSIGKATIDSISLFHRDFKLVLADSKDYFNGLLPLLGPKEEDMLPIVKHPLFNVLINFITTRNLDEMTSDSYLALLANAALHLALQPSHKWIEIMLKRILMSVLMVYGKDESFLKYSELLKSSPEVAVSTKGNMCTDLSKPFIHLLCMIHLERIKKDELYVTLQHFYIYFFKRLTTSNKHLAVLKIVTKKINEQLKDNLMKNFHKYNNMGDLWNDAHDRFKHIESEIEFSPVILNISKLEKTDDKLTIRTVNGIFKYFMNGLPSDDDYLFWLYCAIHYKEQKVISCERDTEKIRKYFFNLIKKRVVGPSVSAVYGQTKDIFLNRFKEEHMYMTPISFGELYAYCTKNGIDILKYEYMKSTNLISNACMCRKCPFYLQIQKDLKKHLDTWSDKCPKAFHKTVKQYLYKTPDEILEKVLSGDDLKVKPKTKWTLKDFNSTKEEAITYIKLLQDAYKKVVEEEGKYSDELRALVEQYSKESDKFYHHKKHKNKGKQDQKESVKGKYKKGEKGKKREKHKKGHKKGP